MHGGAGVGALRYLSVCSGIEAATAAWHPLGWTPAAFSEIEAFPRAVLQHHYGHVPLHGDFTTIGGDEYGPIDLLVGGTPCQSFSVAGLRGGMADDRGNLALEYIRLAYRLRARRVVWENVPGVFSSNGGEDFRCFLSGLVRWSVPIPEGGWQNAGIVAPGPADGSFGVAWRVLDAQFAGVPQRRRRVFVVGHLGDWRRAAAVLFERHSLSGDTPPRREKEPGVAALTANGVGTCGADDNQAQAGHLVPQWPTDIAPTLNAAFGSKLGLEDQHIRGGAGCFVPAAVAFGFDGFQSAQPKATMQFVEEGTGPLVKARPHCVGGASAVRRLTPRECERLQGFPDDYTLIPYRRKPAADGPRYKALGNSMAVPVMRWIGRRIQMVETLQTQAEAA